ncbi:MAG TPA: NADH-quinone oxidoreductase subunit NuoH [Chloroflexota bacterium]|nr:NADH-quinone oxidoreductase subunit NuoH [Chloroflexota bacterium]
MSTLGLIIASLIKSVVVMVILLTGFAYATLLERKLVAGFQVRLGPNRVGPWGMLQPLADGIKVAFQEDTIPRGADRIVFMVAPMLSMVMAIVAFAVIPIGQPVNVFGVTIPLAVADINVGILYLLGATSLGIYGIVLAGWASNNKYSLLGGVRSSAQMISYELSLGLSLVGVLLITGTLNLGQIVQDQSRIWLIFLQPLGFIIYFISAMAETNRAPFDLPEAEHELVAGYHTEYSGMRFALFQMAEYINMITASAVATTLFLGGWHGIFGLADGPWWFFIKVFIFMCLFVWIRATLPRMRYDRLMNFGWRVLLPVALLNVVLTAGGVLLLG